MWLLSAIRNRTSEVVMNAPIFTFTSMTTSDVLFLIADSNHMHADILVFEKDIPKIKVGQTIQFTLSNETKERMATIHLIGRKISKDRTVQVHGHLRREDQNLIAGTYLKATIETGGNKVPALPEAAIVNFEGKEYIFALSEEKTANVEDKGFRFSLIQVKTGLSESGFTEVTLPEGTNLQSLKIVIKGAYDLLSKMKHSKEEE